MRSSRSEIERLVPVLRQVARALVERHRADLADDLVHEALDDVAGHERTWAGGEVDLRLFARLLGANRARLRAETETRHPVPSLSAHGDSASVRPSHSAPLQRGASQGLDRLSLTDREVLILAVLARLDYPRIAEVLGVPVGTVIARLTHARDTLGTALWAPASGEQSGKPRATGSHLRVIK